MSKELCYPSRMSTHQDDIIAVTVIGAGIMGCTVAYQLSLMGLDPYVLEAGPRISEGITSRNSGVVHSGLYYPPASLKAQSCIRGQTLLYEWCSKNNVPFKKVGKWVVGPQAKEEDLNAIYENSLKSGARGVHWKSSKDVKENLPDLNVDIGFFCEESGIVDPYEYSKSFKVLAEEKNATFLMDTRVFEIESCGSFFKIQTSRGEIKSERIVNCAGLFSDQVAAMTGIEKYKIYPCRGDYFKILKKHRYSSLVYPVKPKNSPGLGIHLTLGLDGSLRLGPDAEYVSSKDDFSPADFKKEKFLTAGKMYFRDLKESDIEYDYCGLRPKLRSPEGSTELDFIISEDAPGFINLVGIESPGLTASIDLSERVAALIS